MDAPTAGRDSATSWRLTGSRSLDRENRLVRALLGDPGRFVEARRLSDESARYNIGTIERNFNVPTAALFFFRV